MILAKGLFCQEMPLSEYAHPGEGYYKKFLPTALKILRTSESETGFFFPEPPPLFSPALAELLGRPLESPDFLKKTLSDAKNLQVSSFVLSLCELTVFFHPNREIHENMSPENLLLKNSCIYLEVFGEDRDSILSLAKDVLKDDASLLDLDPYEEYSMSLDYSLFCTSFIEISEKIDLSNHWDAFSELLDMDDISNFESDPAACPYATGEIVKWKDGPAGPVIIGGIGPNTYKLDRGIIFDSGGDDEYFLGENLFSTLLIVDAAGNDRYFATSDFSVAGTFGGVSVIIDSLGDDIYQGKYACLGASIFGMALLEDLSGDDIYIGEIGSCGSSACGIGVLMDREGNDRYISKAYSQGCAGASGVGLLADLSGNDSYVCKGAYLDDLRFSQRYLAFGQGFSIGLRPDIPGGFGILVDGGGNDTYDSDVFSQGCAYWYAFGGLYDTDGNDTYNASQYVQGSGVHLALGILVDSDGDDTYVSKSVSQGCGHDLSTGILIDEGGNDFYTAEGLCQGAGNANSWSFFIESAGDDLYAVKISENSRGWSDTRRDYRGTGLFLDIRGNDSYVGIGGDSTSFLRPDLGLFLDIEDGI